jgi:long-chain fatty acid transport protein
VGLNLGKQVPGLSIGAGLDLVPATVQLENTLTFGDAQGTAKLGGDAFGIGARFGVMYNSPRVPALKLGVMYRTNVKLDFSGKGDFDIAEPFRDALPPDGDIKTSITLPQQVWGGVAYDVLPQLELEYDAVWINWAKFNELRIELPSSADGTMNVTVEREDYKNTLTHRLGVEYKLPAQQAAIRAGFIYDPTPIPTTTLSAQLPDVDRKMLTIGGSKAFGAYGVHAGLLYLLPSERDTSTADPYAPQYKGTYSASAFVLNVSLTGTFGAGAASASASSTPVAAR